MTGCLQVRVPRRHSEVVPSLPCPPSGSCSCLIFCSHPHCCSGPDCHREHALSLKSHSKRCTSAASRRTLCFLLSILLAISVSVHLFCFSLSTRLWLFGRDRSKWCSSPFCGWHRVIIWLELTLRLLHPPSPTFYTPQPLRTTSLAYIFMTDSQPAYDQYLRKKERAARLCGLHR